MSRRPLQPDAPTEQASGIVDESISALRKHVAERRRLSLVVYHHEGTETAPLEQGAPVIVGRRPLLSISVPSGKLSREHARFTLDASGRILVEDLRSTNGTWVRGVSIVAPTEIALGEEVVVGDALALVQTAPPLESPVVASPGGAREETPVAIAPATRELFETSARVAASDVPVILHGETGTGKEVVARFLHQRGLRAARPLVCVNCAAIPESLLESTLFGHERGAFTGAAQRQKGVFEEADGGTVFLDEIGELPQAAQAALLRVLESGRFARVGSPREIAVDVRIVAATHRDLEAARDAGAFRADLYYRLGVMVISIPALRERAEDIEPLARRFMARVGSEKIRDVAPEALALLRAYAWPGNVRELRNVIERAAVLARADVIRPEDLPARIRNPGNPNAFGGVHDGAASGPKPRAGEAGAGPRTHSVGEASPPPAPGKGGLRARLTDYESQMLVETLNATGWNQSEAARRLGMPIRTLSYKVKALGLKKPGS